MQLRFKKLHPEAKIPYYATSGSAGMDVCTVEPIAIGWGQVVVVNTGLAVEIPEGYELQVRPRSGSAMRRGLTVVNSPGTIDEDFRGPIKVILTVVRSPEELALDGMEHPLHLDAGERIAQLVLKKVERLPIVEVTELSETERGEGGLGSTGR